MKIELKSFKYFSSLSEETNAFTADVFVNGKKIAYAKNDGHGGCTFYSAYPNQIEKLKAVEEYVKSLPELNYQGLKIKMNLESFIDNLVDNKVNELETKKAITKLKTQCIKNIIVCDKNEFESYIKGKSLGITYGSFKLKVPYYRLDDNSKQKIINQIKLKIKSNEIIINDLF
jgi:hypothetical protein